MVSHYLQSELHSLIHSYGLFSQVAHLVLSQSEQEPLSTNLPFTQVEHYYVVLQVKQSALQSRMQVVELV